MKLTKLQLAEITNEVIGKKRLVDKSICIDYFGMFNNKVLICTCTFTPDVRRVTCTLDGIDISEQIQPEIEKELFVTIKDNQKISKGYAILLVTMLGIALYCVILFIQKFIIC